MDARLDLARVPAAVLFGRERPAAFGLFFANGLAIGAWAAAIPRLKAALHLSDGSLSLVLLSFAAGAVVTMPLVGFAGARLRSGPATVAAGTVFVTALMALAFAPSLAVLCAMALIAGAANGAMDVAMNAHASDIERRWGRPLMSSFHAGFSLGGAAGAISGSLLAAWAPALGLLGPGLIGGLVIALGGGVLGNAGCGLGRGALAFPSRRLLPLAALAVVVMMTEGAVGDWSGAYLMQSGVAVVYVAGAYAAFSLLMIVGRIFGDRFVRLLGPRATVGFGGLAAAAGLAIAFAAPGLAAGVIGFGLVGAGLANVVPVIFSVAGRAGPSPAVGIASAATAGYAGLLVGPAAVGAVASAADLRLAIAMLALLALLAAGLAFSGAGGLAGSK
jgi:MFS family permease